MYKKVNAILNSKKVPLENQDRKDDIFKAM
jgi:hypothetical protein